jgi:hypothetical protein
MLTFKVRERFVSSQLSSGTVTRNASVYRQLSLYAFHYKHDRAPEVLAHKLMQYKYLSCLVCFPLPITSSILAFCAFNRYVFRRQMESQKILNCMVVSIPRI